MFALISFLVERSVGRIVLAAEARSKRIRGREIFYFFQPAKSPSRFSRGMHRSAWFPRLDIDAPGLRSIRFCSGEWKGMRRPNHTEGEVQGDLRHPDWSGLWSRRDLIARGWKQQAPAHENLGVQGPLMKETPFSLTQKK